MNFGEIQANHKLESISNMSVYHIGQEIDGLPYVMKPLSEAGFQRSRNLRQLSKVNNKPFLK